MYLTPPNRRSLLRAYDAFISLYVFYELVSFVKCFIVLLGHQSTFVTVVLVVAGGFIGLHGFVLFKAFCCSRNEAKSTNRLLCAVLSHGPTNLAGCNCLTYVFASKSCEEQGSHLFSLLGPSPSPSPTPNPSPSLFP